MSEVKKNNNRKTISRSFICGSGMFERIPTLMNNENAIVKKRDNDLQITLKDTLVKEKGNRILYTTVLYLNYLFVNYYKE